MASSAADDGSSDSSAATTGVDYIRGVKYLVDNVPNLGKVPSGYVLKLPKCPSLACHDSIPVIDLKGLGGTDEQRRITVDAIGSACAEWGFFRVVNHGIETSLMEEMLKAVTEFFELSWEEKMKYASEDVMNPVRYGTSLNTSTKHALHWRDYLRHFGHPIHNSFHLWPRNPPKYKPTTQKYLEEIWLLALKIAGGISEALCLHGNYVENSLGQGCQIIASNYYPPCPQPHLTLGLAAHSDHGALTILMQNDVEGLQVKHRDDWISIRYVPGSFVVNVGDYLEILSNGRYKSVEHRAVVNEQKTRISIAVGHGPELTAVVAPASPLVEKGEVKYKSITYKDYMKMQQSSTIRGKSPLEALMTHKT